MIPAKNPTFAALTLISLIAVLFAGVLIAQGAATSQPTPIVLSPTATMVQQNINVSTYVISTIGVKWTVFVFPATTNAPRKIIFQLPHKNLTLISPQNWTSTQLTLIGKATDVLNALH